MSSLMIALGSMCSLPGDVSGNLLQVQDLARKSCAQGADVLLTPEMSITGYGGYEEILEQGEVAGEGEIYRSLATYAAQYQLVILAGFVETHENKKFIAHYIVYPDGTYLVQRKHRVTPREYPLDSPVDLYFDDTEEIGHVHKGDEDFVSFKIKDVNCTVVICADWGVRHLEEVLRTQSSQVVFLPVGAGGTREGVMTIEELSTKENMDKYCEIMDSCGSLSSSLRASYSNNRAVAAVNMCGYDGHSLYHGGSGSIVGPKGELCAMLPAIPILDRQRTTMVVGEVFWEG